MPSAVAYSADSSEDALELVQAVIADDELAATAAAMLDADPGRKFFRQLAFERDDVGIARRGFFRCRTFRRLRAACGFLEFAHRPAVCRRLARKTERELRIERYERLRVPGLDFALLEQRLDLVRQFEQAQEVRHRCARPPDRVGSLLMCI